MKSSELNNKNEKSKELADAIANDDPTSVAKILDERFSDIEKNLLNLHEELKDEKDEEILRARGIRSNNMLTEEEKTFYDKLFKNEVGNNPTTGATLTIPKTLAQRIFDDMKDVQEGILNDIDFMNSTGATEILVSKSEKPVTTWGDLTDGITKELSVGFKVVSTLNNKLSCFVPYAKSIIELGYEWQDAYVRQYIALGLALELTKAAISGDGTKKPWGMAYDYNDESETGTIKTAVKLTEFSKKAFAPIFAKMSKNPMGLRRTVKNVVMYVDSETYYEYVYANDGALNANGIYVSILDQLGIKVKQVETGLEKGKAVIGMPKRYFMESGFKGNKIIEFSDHQFFIEDKRVYKGKAYADGYPKDNNAFELLDLTGMPAATVVDELQAEEDPELGA